MAAPNLARAISCRAELTHTHTELQSKSSVAPGSTMAFLQQQQTDQ